MISALLLSHAILLLQDPEVQFEEARARADIEQLLTSLPMEEYAEDVLIGIADIRFVEGPSGRSRWLRHPLFSVVYYTEENAVFAITFKLPSGPFTTAEVSVEDALVTARECAAAILPHFGSWDVKLQVATEQEYHILATPKIGDIFTKEYVVLQIRRSDGLPVSIGRSSPMMDYSVFLGKQYITKERAVLVGLDAYNRFRPYKACVVDNVRLMMGPPTWSPDIPHEVRQEDIDYMNRKIALPLYRIAIADRLHTRRVQHIYVHAIEGRALSIWANSGFSAGSAIESSLSDAILEAKFGKGKESVTLSPTTERMEKLDEGLPVVSLAIGDAFYAARIDKERERIWLWTDKQWVAYTVDAGAFEVLVGATVKPGTFGKKTDGSLVTR